MKGCQGDGIRVDSDLLGPPQSPALNLFPAVYVEYILRTFADGGHGSAGRNMSKTPFR